VGAIGTGMDEPSDPLSRCCPIGSRVCIDALQSLEVFAGPRTAAADVFVLASTQLLEAGWVREVQEQMSRPIPCRDAALPGLVCIKC